MVQSPTPSANPSPTTSTECIGRWEILNKGLPIQALSRIHGMPRYRRSETPSQASNNQIGSNISSHKHARTPQNSRPNHRPSSRLNRTGQCGSLETGIADRLGALPAMRAHIFKEPAQITTKLGSSHTIGFVPRWFGRSRTLAHGSLCRNAQTSPRTPWHHAGHLSASCNSSVT